MCHNNASLEIFIAVIPKVVEEPVVDLGFGFCASVPLKPIYLNPEVVLVTVYTGFKWGM